MSAPYLLSLYARFARVHPSHLCHKYYSKEYLQHAYGRPINPVPSKSAWSIPEEVSSRVVLPMIGKTQSGRPKQKRIRSIGESTRVKKCGKCGQPGHSRLRCRNPLSSSVGSTSVDRSQEETTSIRRRVLHCRRCGLAGHTARNCQAVLPQVNAIIDVSSRVGGSAEEYNVIRTSDDINDVYGTM